MITPFINFDGKCHDAIQFYETVFEVTDKFVMYYKDAPGVELPVPAEMENNVMHARLYLNGTSVWFGDSPNGITQGDMITLAIPLATVQEVEETFRKLSDSGQVLMPLGPQFYTEMFGCVQDKFGVIWHIMCSE